MSCGHNSGSDREEKSTRGDGRAPAHRIAERTTKQRTNHSAWGCDSKFELYMNGDNARGQSNRREYTPTTSGEIELSGPSKGTLGYLE